jgi:hypothetical protein
VGVLEDCDPLAFVNIIGVELHVLKPNDRGVEL